MKLIRIIVLLKYLIPFIALIRDGIKIFFDNKVQKTQQNNTVVMSGESEDNQKLAIGVDKDDPNLIYIVVKVKKSSWPNKNDLVEQFEWQVLNPIEKFLGQKNLDIVRQNVQLLAKGDSWEVSAEIEVEE